MSRYRQHARHEITLPVQIIVDGERHHGWMHDLSIGGLRFEREVGSPELCTGNRVTLEFSLPELAAPVRTTVVIRWLDQGNPRIVGAQFVPGLRAMQAWAIDRMKRPNAGTFADTDTAGTTIVPADPFSSFVG